MSNWSKRNKNMINKELISEMFNRMDEDFKQQHKIRVENMLKTYPCVCLMKDDLIGYAENEYNTDDETKVKLIKHIENLDDGEMDYIAGKLVTDPMMDSFWYGIEYQLDLICEQIV
jgi:hypothetical protein